MLTDQLHALLAAGLPDCDVRVETDGYHYTVTAIGSVFAGLSPVKKQQLIYGCIKHLIADGTLHAVNIRTYTQEEWQKVGG